MWHTVTVVATSWEWPRVESQSQMNWWTLGIAFMRNSWVNTLTHPRFSTAHARLYDVMRSASALWIVMQLAMLANLAMHWIGIYVGIKLMKHQKVALRSWVSQRTQTPWDDPGLHEKCVQGLQRCNFKDFESRKGVHVVFMVCVAVFKNFWKRMERSSWSWILISIVLTSNPCYDFLDFVFMSPKVVCRSWCSSFCIFCFPGSYG